MEAIFIIGMISAMSACWMLAHGNNSFDSVVKRNADFDAAMNFKADERHDDSIGVVLMRADELDITP